MKQPKADRSDVAREVTLTVRTMKRIKSLAEIAARESDRSLSHHVETLLLADFERVIVGRIDEGEPGTPLTQVCGRPLSEIVDEVYNDDDVSCLFKRLRHPRYLSDEQHKLVRMFKLSPILYRNDGSWDESLIRQNWDALNKRAEGYADASAIVGEFFGNADVEFALMSEADHIKLWRADKDEFMRRNTRYEEATKRRGR